MRFGLPRFRKAGKTRGLVPLPEIGSHTKVLKDVMLRCTVKKLKDVSSRSHAPKKHAVWGLASYNILFTFKRYESVTETKVHKKSKKKKSKAMLLVNIISYPLLLILLGCFPAGQE